MAIGTIYWKTRKKHLLENQVFIWGKKAIFQVLFTPSPFISYFLSNSVFESF